MAVRVTPDAARILRALALHEGAAQVLRLVAGEGDGYRLEFGEPQPGDEPAADGDGVLLHVQARIHDAVASGRLAVQRSGGGERLVVRTPQLYPFGPLTKAVELPG